MEPDPVEEIPAFPAGREDGREPIAPRRVEHLGEDSCRSRRPALVAAKHRRLRCGRRQRRRTQRDRDEAACGGNSCSLPTPQSEFGAASSPLYATGERPAALRSMSAPMSMRTHGDGGAEARERVQAAAEHAAELGRRTAGRARRRAARRGQGAGGEMRGVRRDAARWCRSIPGRW